MLKEGRFAELIQLHALLRRFLAKNLQRTDLFFTFTILLQRIIRKFLGRKGLRIALLGPDGSGKSTLATLIQEKGMGPSVCVYMGRDQFIIPTRRLIKWLRSKIRKDRETSSKEVNPSPSSQLETLIPVRGRTRDILDVFRLFHDLADYYARYFFKNYLNCRKGFLVINDRYIYDMLSGSEKVQRLPVVQWIIMHLFPAPDYIFLLDAPVDAMYARKGEHTTELLTSMKEHILKLQDQLDNCYIIQTNRNPEESASEIISHIWRAYFHNLAKH
jgi:thymidylate kinase